MSMRGEQAAELPRCQGRREDSNAEIKIKVSSRGGCADFVSPRSSLPRIAEATRSELPGGNTVR